MTAPTSLTASGTQFPLTRPTPAAVAWDDIATALSRLPRWAGHTSRPYSVAQHCIVVSHLCRHFATLHNERVGDRVSLAAASLYGLLHDAHEALIGDITRPTAHALEAIADEVSPGRGAIVRTAIRDLKSRLDCAIFGRASLPWPMGAAMEAIVRRADNTSLATEARDLMPAGATRYCGAPPLPEPISRIWTAEQAREAWLIRLADLGVPRI